jgi:hypothetical protein
MRDAWKMRDVAEEALQQFSLNLPHDYRNRPSSDRPDVVSRLT